MAEPFYADESVTLWLGDALQILRQMPAESVNCCVTSPPYFGLRDYGVPGQYGLEPSPGEYVETMRAVFAEVRRVLADDGTLWLNLGDSFVGNGGANRNADFNERWGNASGQRKQEQGRLEVRDPEKWGRWTKDYEGLQPKNLLGMPWRVAFALQADGWILRNAIVWDKPNPMPESVTDRLSTTYELVFMLAKSRRYWFELGAIREPDTGQDHRRIVLTGPSLEPSGGLRSPNKGIRTAEGRNGLGRNPGDVWTLPTQPFPEAHFAVMAPELARRCIVAGCKPGGVVLDPFAGSGTTGMVAQQHGRRFVGIDLNREYLELALRTRLAQTAIVDEVTHV